MRIETNYTIFIYTLIGLLVVLALSKTNMPRTAYKIILALTLAIIMPSFIPGHGEILMLIPNGALFMVTSAEAKTVGVIFTVLNYCIAWFVLNKVRDLFKDNT